MQNSRAISLVLDFLATETIFRLRRPSSLQAAQTVNESCLPFTSASSFLCFPLCRIKNKTGLLV
jgi:hypothetical protein